MRVSASESRRAQRVPMRGLGRVTYVDIVDIVAVTGIAVTCL